MTKSEVDVILADGLEIGKSIFDTNIAGERDSKGLALGGHVDFDVPADCDLVILMGNKGGGYVPYRCLLPHQIYMDDLKADFEKHFFEVIYVLPVSSKAPFQIAYSGTYGKQRWAKP